MNIRSVSAKIDDIKCDEFLQSVDVLCMSQQTPNVIDGSSTIIRRGRTSDSRGGGLMIICKKNVLYTPNDIQLSNNGIECINGIVKLCSIPIILSVIYRPRSSSTYEQSVEYFK